MLLSACWYIMYIACYNNHNHNHNYNHNHNHTQLCGEPLENFPFPLHPVSQKPVWWQVVWSFLKFIKQKFWRRRVKSVTYNVIIFKTAFLDLCTANRPPIFSTAPDWRLAGFSNLHWKNRTMYNRHIIGAIETIRLQSTTYNPSLLDARRCHLSNQSFSSPIAFEFNININMSTTQDAQNAFQMAQVA